MLIKTTWFGIFILDGGKVVKYKLFPKNHEKIAKKLLEISEGRLLPEERLLVSEFENLTTSDRRIARLGIPYIQDPAEISPEKYGYGKDLLRNATAEMAKIKMRHTGKDVQIIQRVRALEMLNRVENLVFELLCDWYAHHFPELEGLVKREDFPHLVAEHGHRNRIAEKLGITVDSAGGEFEEKDLGDIQKLAELVAEIQKTREKLSKNLESVMDEYAPELSKTAGPIIGAKLIEKTGSLKKLAMLPSSTIQILGAEKAFFRYLRKRGKMPKHGLIYQHPSIKHGVKSERGKLSRALAAKIAIAARRDAFGRPEDTKECNPDELE
ncbi:MAG: hypothetical protein N3F63_07355 [Thermoplasmata archaeon]|nr:hypothetical protein [Thermoplasmata archaeon]